MIKLAEHKHPTENNPIEKAPLPQSAYIPLSQHLGKICAPLVKTGDYVCTGQKIGAVDAHVYSPVHASVSGKVGSIQDWPHPVLGKCPAIRIDSDNNDKKCDVAVLPEEEILNLTSQQIRDMVFEAGIVGMGGASFPTHIKLNPPLEVSDLIINGAECEPYLTGDYRLMVEKPIEILKGVKLIARCLGVKDIYFAIEENKPAAVAFFKKQEEQWGFKVRVLSSRYPQGGEKQLTKTVLKKEVPRGKLPFEVGAVIHNVGTCLAVYEAVYLRKPLYERVVTVTGSCLTNPKNLLVRIGTPIKQLIEACGPLKEEPVRIISGGPMMGIAQYTLDAPVIKSTTGIILFGEREIPRLEEEFCIRCGACVRNCPVGLTPCFISLASQRNNWEAASSYNVADCIECGVCAYVCPAKRNMVQHMKYAKFMLARQK